MSATPITGSSNITSLDSKIVASLCDGNFHIDVTPSVFLAGGTSTSGGVQGASVKITNPVGVVIKQYPTSGFDIYPPMTDVVDFPIPLIAGNFQYGTYIIDVRLTDEDGTQYTVSKTVNICPPDPNNKTKKEGCLGASIQGNCLTGEVIVLLNNPPTYKNTAATTQENTLTLQYPTESELPPINTTINNVSVTLFNGEYILSGSVCALYSYGDEVYFNVKYKVSCKKTIRCLLDECCVEGKLTELSLKLDSDCTQAEKDATSSIALGALFLFNLAKMQANCGVDPSDTVGKLEALLGCTCTCNCNDATSVADSTNPVSLNTDFIYRGVALQEATNNPTTEISDQNTITIDWVRTAQGIYEGTPDAGFGTPDNGRVLVLHSGSVVGFIEVFYNDGKFYAKTAGVDGFAADDILNYTSIQVSLL